MAGQRDFRTCIPADAAFSITLTVETSQVLQLLDRAELSSLLSLQIVSDLILLFFERMFWTTLHCLSEK